MRGHRTLVFLDDSTGQELWGWWCIDCDAHRFGSSTQLHPGRMAKRHEKETRPVLQEAA